MALDQERAHTENTRRLVEQHERQRADDTKRYGEVLSHRMAEQERRLKEGFAATAQQMQQSINNLSSRLFSICSHDGDDDDDDGFCAIL
jgi:hypothetical protein